ncbi:MAG: stage II sporulation protein M [Methanoregulaceae archaeon]|nr:stage II sporulation protein M [Methanoregulaceae archaeon]
MSEFSQAVLFTLFIFIASIVAGIMVTVGNPEAGQQMLNIFKDAILGEFFDSSPAMIALKLFLNNLEACIFMFLGGASLGVVTAFIIMTNGVVIGSIIELFRQEQGILYITAALIPHGLFEISAFIISGSLGFLLTRELWREWNGEGDAAGTALGMGRTFLRVVIPLVAIAAFTEVFITPEIIRLVA